MFIFLFGLTGSSGSCTLSIIWILPFGTNFFDVSINSSVISSITFFASIGSILLYLTSSIWVSVREVTVKFSNTLLVSTSKFELPKAFQLNP